MCRGREGEGEEKGKGREGGGEIEREGQRTGK